MNQLMKLQVMVSAFTATGVWLNLFSNLKKYKQENQK